MIQNLVETPKRAAETRIKPFHYEVLVLTAAPVRYSKQQVF